MINRHQSVLLAALIACQPLACTVSTIFSRSAPLFTPGAEFDEMAIDKWGNNLNVGNYQLKRGITHGSSSAAPLRPARNVALSPGHGVSGTEGYSDERFDFMTGSGAMEGHCTLTKNGVRVKALGINFVDQREATLQCDCRDTTGLMSFLVLERKDGHHRPGTLQLEGEQFKLNVVTKATGFAVVPLGYRVEGEKTAGAIQVSRMTLDKYLWLARDLAPKNREHMACLLSAVLVYHESQ